MGLTAAHVEPDVHVCRPGGEAVVVEVDVGEEDFLDGLRVGGVLGPASAHGVGAEVWVLEKG